MLPTKRQPFNMFSTRAKIHKQGLGSVTCWMEADRLQREIQHTIPTVSFHKLSPKSVTLSVHAPKITKQFKIVQMGWTRSRQCSRTLPIDLLPTNCCLAISSLPFPGSRNERLFSKSQEILLFFKNFCFDLFLFFNFVLKLFSKCYFFVAFLPAEKYQEFPSFPCRTSTQTATGRVPTHTNTSDTSLFGTPL